MSYCSNSGVCRRFAQSKGIDPEAPAALVLYLLKRAEEGRSLGVLRTVTAARTFCAGEALPTRMNTVVSRLCASVSRNQIVKHRDKAPIDQVRYLIQYANENPERESVRTAVGAMLAFGALLRVSELVALRWADLNQQEDRVTVFVARAKNDQEEAGRSTFISLPHNSPGRFLLEAYKTMVTSAPLSPIFPSFSNPSVPISPDTFRSLLYRLCSKCGVPRMTPHALRGGGANFSIISGASAPEVQRRGRWKSAAGMSPYITDTVEAQGGMIIM